MEPQLKSEWITALRSGEYKQNSGVLKGVIVTLGDGEYIEDDQEIGHCCLGVLCEVLAKQGVGEWGTDGVTFFFGNDSYSTSLTGDLVNSKKLLTDIGLSEASQDRLISMNDVERRNFDEIADHIEEYLCEDE